MNLMRFDKALQAYTKTLEIEGPSSETYCHLAASYEKLLEFGLAIKYYHKASKLDNLYHEAWFGVAVCLSLQEKHYEAIHFFNKALKIDPENPLYWKGVAEAENKVGNVVSAIQAYEEASDLDAEDTSIWLDWSALLFDQGDYDRANELIEEGLAECPDAADLYYRSVVYLIESGKYKMAINRLETALMLDFESHTELFDYFPNLQTQKAIYKIVEQYRKNNQ
jgi:tetratricopeptide (TPR) repeat protein